MGLEEAVLEKSVLLEGITHTQRSPGVPPGCRNSGVLSYFWAGANPIADHTWPGWTQ